MPASIEDPTWIVVLITALVAALVAVVVHVAGRAVLRRVTRQSGARRRTNCATSWWCATGAACC